MARVDQMLHVVVIEQMKLMNLMWDSPGAIPEERHELPSSIGLYRTN